MFCYYANKIFRTMWNVNELAWVNLIAWIIVDKQGRE